MRMMVRNKMYIYMYAMYAPWACASSLHRLRIAIFVATELRSGGEARPLSRVSHVAHVAAKDQRLPPLARSEAGARKAWWTRKTQEGWLASCCSRRAISRCAGSRGAAFNVGADTESAPAAATASVQHSHHPQGHRISQTPHKSPHKKWTRPAAFTGPSAFGADVAYMREHGCSAAAFAAVASGGRRPD